MMKEDGNFVKNEDGGKMIVVKYSNHVGPRLVEAKRRLHYLSPHFCIDNLSLKL